MTSPSPRTSHVPAPASPESTGAPVSTPGPSPADVARPSFVQITASVLTALTSTVALSYLGVAGTLIGAAVAAVLTAFANYLYTRSLVRTRYVVTTLAPRVVRAPGDTAVMPAVAPAGITTALPAAAAAPDAEPAASGAPAPADRTPEELMAPARRSRRPYVITALVTFVLVIAAVTVVELGLGKPLSDAVRGQEGSGTTISGVRPSRGAPTPAPAPDEAPGEAPEPSVEPTEPAAPTPEPTSPPTQAPTAPPTTPAPTDVPPDAPTEAPAPTPEPTAPPAAPAPGTDSAPLGEPEGTSSDQDAATYLRSSLQYE